MFLIMRISHKHNPLW